MTRIFVLPKVGADLKRIHDHLAAHDVTDVAMRITEIIAALDILQTSPRIGRRVARGKRELVIGRDARGYLALYRHDATLDAVFVLCVRSQREAGFRRA